MSSLSRLLLTVTVFMTSDALIPGIDHKVIACRMQVSTRAWNRLAVEARKIEDSIRDKYLTEKALFTALYRQFKGSADLFHSLPEINMLSPEALWQLNQNCVLAPSGLDLLLGNAEMSYPEFYQRYPNTTHVRHFTSMLPGIKAISAQCETLSENFEMTSKTVAVNTLCWAQEVFELIKRERIQLPHPK